MNVAIIGCGLIGKKRASALAGEDVLVGCCDSDEKTLVDFSAQFKCKAYSDHRKLVEESGCEAVVVAVVNKYAKDIVLASLSSGKHVLAEKPLGRNAEEAMAMVSCSSAHVQLQSAQGASGVSSDAKPILKTGFNHRFHPAIMNAKKKADAGEIGTLLSIRGRYGHGGRPGMEREWRASKELCGGGEMLDQGVHLIDLVRWFGGDVSRVMGIVETKFWTMEVEDSASAILATRQNVTATINVSWYNWKNIFSFEVFGTEGYLRIEGLGGGYGPESLEFGKRNKQGGRPIIETFDFASEDISWKEEWKEFKASILEHREPLANGVDGWKANVVVKAIYDSSGQKREVVLEY